MKKLLLVLAIGAFAASCNSSTESETTVTDSIVTVDTSMAPMVDTSMAPMADTMTIKTDSTVIVK